VVLVEQALPLEDAMVVKVVEIISAENVEIEMILAVRGRDGECGRRDFGRRCAGGRSRRDGRNRRRGGWCGRRRASGSDDGA
jgi:hypothetical protein